MYRVDEGEKLQICISIIPYLSVPIVLGEWTCYYIGNLPRVPCLDVKLTSPAVSTFNLAIPSQSHPHPHSPSHSHPFPYSIPIPIPYPHPHPHCHPHPAPPKLLLSALNVNCHTLDFLLLAVHDTGRTDVYMVLPSHRLLESILWARSTHHRFLTVVGTSTMLGAT